MPPPAAFSVSEAVSRTFEDQPIVDIHTHLYPAQMGPLCLMGPDELLTYHYLKVETCRQLPPGTSVAQFNALPKPRQADIVWRALFAGNGSPLSEAQLGVVTVMSSLGLNPRADTLSEFRALFSETNPEDYVDLIFRNSGVSRVYMTNDPLDEQEGPVWRAGFERDPRFEAALRLDSALAGWPAPVANLRELGYTVGNDLSTRTIAQLRRYLDDWIARMNARYLAISLPPDFAYPSESAVSKLLDVAVFPTARDRGIPAAMMVGVRRGVNPLLRDGGDGIGKWDVTFLENIAREWPDVNFLVTLLSRENQHELCVAARKFPNVTPFGCWWFLNNPSIIQEVTAERLELLGSGFVPQHSDARVLDQLLYKWNHSINAIAPVFVRKYKALRNAGWTLTEQDIRNDVARMFGGGSLFTPNPNGDSHP
ncbi:MAG: glucuronate isomerase [Gemmatimonadota bacterium]|nr:glucuronate isomerase [Gemmatimonadota bacterium]